MAGGYVLSAERIPVYYLSRSLHSFLFVAFNFDSERMEIPSLGTVVECPIFIIVDEIRFPWHSVAFRCSLVEIGRQGLVV